MRTSASWLTHAGTPSLPVILVWPSAQCEGARLCSEGSRPPAAPGRVSWPQPVSSQSPAWVCPASLLCSFPRKWKQPLSLNSLEEKPKRISWPKRPRLGVPSRQDTLLGLHSASSFWELPGKRSSLSFQAGGTVGSVPPSDPLPRPSPCPQTQPGPTNPDL